jgi:hypothetical protein
MADDDAFLSRWSRRKAAVRDGAAVPAEPAAAVPVRPVGAQPAPAAAVAVGPAGAAPAAASAETAPRPPPEPLPTLDDVSRLTPESDYTRFVARGVDPTVKNAALKKLFTDPHFNVMDGLDTYIDDYGRPDPLPPGMLEQLFQSRGLGLFDTRFDTKPAEPTDLPTALQPEPPAEPPSAPPEALPDEDPDLRLQPDDAARRAGTAQGPGGHTGRPD